jgi:MerR family transcriptional regulator, copper efflux regulator
MKCMNIGEAAAAAGVTAKMIRHYESLGLIPAVERTEAGYRLYTAREVEMLRFVRQSRALGFSIQQIDSLLALWRDEHRESRAVKDLARQQLAELDARQHELDEMRRTLAGLIEHCAGDEGACCAILQRLAAPVPVERHTNARKASSTLKQVKAGSSVPHARKPRPPHPAHQAAMGHSGLVAWSRSFASPS